MACLLGGIPFPIKIMHSAMSTLQETVYRNDSVLFNLLEFCFININYDLKVSSTTNVSYLNRVNFVFVMEHRLMCINMSMQS